MIPTQAFTYAFDNHTKPGFDLEYYQKIVCKDAYWAICFALNIPGANIEYCQKHACVDPQSAYYFARDIPSANIVYCRKVCESDECYLDRFDKMIIERAML